MAAMAISHIPPPFRSPSLHLHLRHGRHLFFSTGPPPRSPAHWLLAWNSNPRTRLRRPPISAVDYSPSTSSLSSDEEELLVGTSLATRGGTMSNIVRKLQELGYINNQSGSAGPSESPLPEKGSVEDVFYADDGVLPNVHGGLDDEVFPWERRNAEAAAEAERRRRKVSRTSLAELTLPQGELRRLRHMAIRMKSKMKIGGSGVTKEVVSAIHDLWKAAEVVRIKVEGAPALNMRRMHEILERKTGGLVIWRSGTSLSLYRGLTYDVPKSPKKSYLSSESSGSPKKSYLSSQSSGLTVLPNTDDKFDELHVAVESAEEPPEKKSRTESHHEVVYENEIDKLLDELGPRYDDWPGGDPLPVDADLLPGAVRDYKPPFRILPYGVRRYLGINETTNLRRLARVLPPHFALGRSRQLQGLATAMVKLWEKSLIAKIALKRGVQLTTSERMAEDIKKLTGGTLLSRNKEFLVFYRGKDFLSSEVTEVLLERERLAKALQDQEEQARLSAATSFASNVETAEENIQTGTLKESLEAHSKYGVHLDEDHMVKMTRVVEIARYTALSRKLQRKLMIAEKKIMRAERALAKVEASLKPSEPSKEPEVITEEERFMFRKLGLRMNAFLLLGRRGVFDGTIENMHLHWKYRELVKIIVKAKTFGLVKSIALSLEAESGGVLVSVDKISKGYAIIVFRGREYHRPPALRPKNLLTKRKALARSIELQRYEAISRHISRLNRGVEQLKSELAQIEGVKDQGDDELYEKLDSAYSSEEEDAVDEGDDDTYIRSFDGELEKDVSGEGTRSSANDISSDSSEGVDSEIDGCGDDGENDDSVDEIKYFDSVYSASNGLEVDGGDGETVMK